MRKTLVVIFAFAILLFGSASALQNVARTNAQAEHVRLMETLLPGNTDFKKIPYTKGESAIRSIHQSSGGFVIETITEGYANEIVMQIGVNREGRVTGLVTYNAHETLGLGSKILTDQAFLSQFLNQTGSFQVGNWEEDSFSGATAETETTGKEIRIDGISGATVSSKAVARSVSAAVAYVTGADITSSATSWGG